MDIIGIEQFIIERCSNEVPLISALKKNHLDPVYQDKACSNPLKSLSYIINIVCVNNRMERKQKQIHFMI